LDKAHGKQTSLFADIINHDAQMVESEDATQYSHNHRCVTKRVDEKFREKRKQQDG
jgi:hypothetical protein